ncbi:MAG: hypothetical protein AAFQ63_13220 [Cyanobacteria bacterium J06621_11]
MTSGPYQSNVLRFLMRQYRQGVSRHAKAVRQTRSTVSFGVSVGATVALLPVYAAVRASQSTTQTLKKVIGERFLLRRLSAKGWFGLNEKTKKLLDFSDFDSLAVQSSRWLGTEASQCAEIACFDDSAVVHSENAMVQTLLAVGRYLSSGQVDALLEGVLPQQDLPENKWTGENKRTSLEARSSMGRFIALGQHCFNWIVRRTKTASLLGNEAMSITSANVSADVSINRNRGLITGVASDIVTRSLVLVQDHINVWDGLTPEQRRKLHIQIARFLGSGLLTMSTVQKLEENTLKIDTAIVSRSSSDAIQPFQVPIISTIATVTSTLVQPVYSFWLAVLQVLAKFPQPWRTQLLAVLAPGQNQLPRKTRSTLKQLKKNQVAALPEPFINQFMLLLSNSHLLQVTSHEWVEALPVRAAEETSASTLQKAPTAVEYCPSFLEADVVSIDYVEHPFERVLKWIDRICLWIEDVWQVWMKRLTRSLNDKG